jgi:hypothetical protein
MSPQLSACESVLPGSELRQVQDDSTNPLPPPVGTDGDHRHVGKPRYRFPAGAVLSERLQYERNRDRLAVLLHDHREIRRIGQPEVNLLLSLVKISGRHRSRRQSDLGLPSGIGHRPQASHLSGIGSAGGAGCQHQPKLVKPVVDNITHEARLN